MGNSIEPPSSFNIRLPCPLIWSAVGSFTHDMHTSLNSGMFKWEANDATHLFKGVADLLNSNIPSKLQFLDSMVGKAVYIFKEVLPIDRDLEKEGRVVLKELRVHSFWGCDNPHPPQRCQSHFIQKAEVGIPGAFCGPEMTSLSKRRPETSPLFSQKNSSAANDSKGNVQTLFSYIPWYLS